jgi:hypothetical protein
MVGGAFYGPPLRLICKNNSKEEPSMKTHVINLLPFNNRTEMSRTEYVIKKVLAFILIFFVAGV